MDEKKGTTSLVNKHTYVNAVFDTETQPDRLRCCIFFNRNLLDFLYCMDVLKIRLTNQSSTVMVAAQTNVHRDADVTCSRAQSLYNEQHADFKNTDDDITVTVYSHFSVFLDGSWSVCDHKER